MHSDFPGGSDGKASAYNAGDLGSVPGPGSPLEKETATHSSIPAWKIPWTKEPGTVHGVTELDKAEHACILFHRPMFLFFLYSSILF